MCYEATDNSTSLSQLSYPGAFTHVSHRQHVEQAKSVRSTASVWCCRCSKQPTCDVVISHTPELSTYLFDNNNNIQHNVYGAVIMAEPLREFTRFIWWMKNDAKRPPTQDQARRLRLWVRLYSTSCQSLHPPSSFIIITQPES